MHDIHMRSAVRLNDALPFCFSLPSSCRQLCKIGFLCGGPANGRGASTRAKPTNPFLKGYASGALARAVERWRGARTYTSIN